VPVANDDPCMATALTPQIRSPGSHHRTVRATVRS
jgi:hypothetical protein